MAMYLHPVRGRRLYSITTGSMQNSEYPQFPGHHGYGTGAAANADVGSYNTIVPSAVVGANGFTTNNYNINYVNGNINIGTRALTLTAQTATRVYRHRFKRSDRLNSIFDDQRHSKRRDRGEE